MEKKVSKEIDVIDILKRVFIEWRLLIKVIAIAAIIGIVIALNTEKVHDNSYFGTRTIYWITNGF